ncbi:MAG TPA: hypothetical protein VE338_15060 [Ktedonobacterales bacterium]|jgi:hypothetical protein|nr:hypothetical protein [Ktedonobacterales bacterium]
MSNLSDLTSSASARRGDSPPERPVRHVFWKYPIVAAVMLVVVILLAALVGSPNWPRDTIASVTQKDPGGAILAFTQELDGTAASTTNAQEFGMSDPAQVFVIGPLTQAAPLLGQPVDTALTTYTNASADQRLAWASAYDKALGTITPMTSGGDNMGIASPDYQKVGTLTGDFGPVPTLTQAELKLAQTGDLEQYLLSVDPGHSFHLVNIWLYDHPAMLNTAVANGLTDDQWGMVKERGFAVGPWYLFLPAVIHVKLPNGADGAGFVIDNLLLAAFFLFAVPLLPGLRSLPKYLKLYRFIYRYPRRGELESAELAPWPGGYHNRPYTEVDVEPTSTQEGAVGAFAPGASAIPAGGLLGEVAP